MELVGEQHKAEIRRKRGGKEKGNRRNFMETESTLQQETIVERVMVPPGKGSRIHGTVDRT